MIQLERDEQIPVSPLEEDLECNDQSMDYQRNSFKERFSRIWSGWRGLSVMGLGVALPAAIITTYGIARFEGIFHIILRQPVETLIEAMLVLLVPVANYKAWSILNDEKPRHRPATWIANGAAIGTTAFMFVIAVSALAVGLPQQGYGTGLLTATLTLIAATAMSSLVCAGFLARKLCLTWQTAGARASTMIFILTGAVVSLAGFTGAETRATIVRYAEHLAVSGDRQERHKGLDMLRSMNAERDLRLMCGDARVAGLPGLFFNVDTVTERQLYFTVTGKPYRNNLTADLSALPDDDLMRHAVGEQLEGLSLVRSSIAGSLHPRTLSSTIHWTFVFKNNKYQEQTARAQFQLPPDSVLSGITLWEDGQPKQGAVGATGQLAGRTNTFYTDGYDPMVVEDLGKGRILLTCNRVPVRGELKVQVDITAPLKLQTESESILSLPRFTATNFAIKEGNHILRMRSESNLSIGLESLRRRLVPGGDHLTVGKLKPEHLFNSNLSVVARRNYQGETIAVLDPFSKNGNLIVQTVKATSTYKPRHLVVVVDGSRALKPHLKAIKETLSKIPAHISTSMIFASEDHENDLVPLAKGLSMLNEDSFSGGQDNLESVIKAAETAGETDGGAVLWIHGPQSSYNREIYIMAPYIASPLFYECAIDNSWSDASEFLKNHREIGPFIPVERTDSMAGDLSRFVSAWKEGSKTYDVTLTRTDRAENALHIESGPIPLELARLAAFREYGNLMEKGAQDKAALLAVRYKLITPTTTSVVLNRESDYAEIGGRVSSTGDSSFQDMLHTQTKYSEEALQGATNGTIFASGGSHDATVISGVNTAGTVRVNNLANLEAFLNIFANGSEILGILIGLFNIIAGVMQKQMKVPFRMTARSRIAFGVTVALVGLCIPGGINWLVASARDANLFC